MDASPVFPAPCGLARDAAERFFNSVIISAHNFIKPKASPYTDLGVLSWIRGGDLLMSVILCSIIKVCTS